MKKSIFLSLFIPSILFSQWVQQNVPNNIELILSIDFANTNIGAAGGWGGGFWGKAVYTTNSGANWYPAQVPDSSRSLVELQLIDNNTGYIAGAYNVYKDNPIKTAPHKLQKNFSSWNYYEKIGMTGRDEDYRGLFLKTTNGGRNWFTLNHLPANVYYLTGMKFINVNTGFVSASLQYSGGISNSILKTTNGGLSWNSLYQIDTADINNIYTADGYTIFVSGWKGYSNNISKGMILKTSNGGGLWDIKFFNETGHISDVSFLNSYTGFAVSNIGSIIIDTLLPSVIYKTTNTGVNWVMLGFENPYSSYERVEFVPNTGKGIAVGYKLSNEYFLDSLLISRTTNYGINWTNCFITDDTHILVGSCLVDEYTWFVAGGISNAIVYKSTNGGAIGIQPVSNEIPNQFSVSQNYPNPFNPKSNIKFQIAKSGEVKLMIFDVLGREVTTLVNERLNPGTYEVIWDASSYPSGVYFYKLITNDYSETRKMVLVK